MEACLEAWPQGIMNGQGIPRGHHIVRSRTEEANLGTTSALLAGTPHGRCARKHRSFGVVEYRRPPRPTATATDGHHNRQPQLLSSCLIASTNTYRRSQGQDKSNHSHPGHIPRTSIIDIGNKSNRNNLLPKQPRKQNINANKKIPTNGHAKKQ